VASCASGVCAEAPKDCSSAADECNTGVCDTGTGACVKQPVQNGTGCGNGGQCQAGGCVVSCPEVGGTVQCAPGEACVITTPSPQLGICCEQGLAACQPLVLSTTSVGLGLPECCASGEICAPFPAFVTAFPFTGAVGECCAAGNETCLVPTFGIIPPGTVTINQTCCASGACKALIPGTTSIGACCPDGDPCVTLSGSGNNMIGAAVSCCPSGQTCMPSSFTPGGFLAPISACCGAGFEACAVGVPGTAGFTVGCCAEGGCQVNSTGANTCCPANETVCAAPFETRCCPTGETCSVDQAGQFTCCAGQTCTVSGLATPVCCPNLTQCAASTGGPLCVPIP
jgi:hypothetical protein